MIRDQRQVSRIRRETDESFERGLLDIKFGKKQPSRKVPNFKNCKPHGVGEK